MEKYFLWKSEQAIIAQVDFNLIKESDRTIDLPLVAILTSELLSNYFNIVYCHFWDFDASCVYLSSFWQGEKSDRIYNDCRKNPIVRVLIPNNPYILNKVKQWTKLSASQLKDFEYKSRMEKMFKSYEQLNLELKNNQ